MSIKKGYYILQILAAMVMLIAGAVLLLGCENKKQQAFPESVSVQDLEKALVNDTLSVAAEEFLVNPDGQKLTCELVEAPTVTAEGQYDYKLKITAENGAVKTFTAKLNVYVDKEAPVIAGVSDKRFTLTEKVSYMKGVSATDNHDGDVKVNVDNSAIKFDESNQPVPGIYTVVYTATDKAGNVARAEASFIFSKENITDEMIDQAVNEVLERITTPLMSNADKAWAIYLYSYRYIEYTGKSEKGDYRAEAYRGITTKEGDCYTYYSVAKALLIAADITDIIDVTRMPGGPMEAEHYWMLVNLGSGYYHFDSTRKHNWQDGFMQTDAQMREYENSDTANAGYFYRDESLYPKTPDKLFNYTKDYNMVK